MLVFILAVGCVRVLLRKGGSNQEIKNEERDKIQKKLQTNTAEEILSTVYKPIEYFIDGLLAQGLYILAGSQKVGKSWLALDICHSVAVNTLGETVTSAQDMVTIVPINTPVEMVCYVKNMDIADIEIGMEAEIKLEAYSYNKYGTVKHIRPSSFSSEQMGSVYLVKIDITDIPKGINLTSGLSGSVEIKTVKRTVISYFLDPIIKGFGESLKEK